MNQHRFASTLFCAAMALFLISCGGGSSGEKSSTDTTATTTDTTATTTPQMQTNSIITTPTNMLVVRHKVANYEKWKPAYDGHDSMRQADGLHNFIIGRGVPDSNMVIVALKADDLAKAKAFAKDPSLKTAMKKGGVVGAPSIKYITMVYQDTSMTDSKMRSATMIRVKDWDAWKKSFDSTHALKTDNGLMVRAYGHDADDNHNVTIVSAILDSAKAHAFWNSDLIKQRMAAGGVVGKPDRFIYQIVQKY